MTGRSVIGRPDSLGGALARRLAATLIASLLVFGVAATLGMQQLNSIAVDQALSREVSHVKEALAEEERRWELEAATLRSLGEFSRVFEATEAPIVRARFISFVTSIAPSSSFSHFAVVEPAGTVLLSHGMTAPQPEIAPQASAGSRWFFGGPDRVLYRVMGFPVLVAGSPAFFLVYKPVDNALLSRVASSASRVIVHWEGSPVASSKALAAAMSGAEVEASAAFTWEQGAAGPELSVTRRLTLPISATALLFYVITLVGLLGGLVWLVVGRWLAGQVVRVQRLEAAAMRYGAAQSLTGEVARLLDAARGAEQDEIGLLGANLRRMMLQIDDGRTAASQLAAIVENSNDIIFTRDMAGMVLTWNAGGERMLGYAAAEVIGQPIWLALPQDDPYPLALNTARVARGEIIRFERTIRAKNGREIDVSGTLSPVRDHAGVITSISCLMQDISGRKAAERNRAALEVQLREAQKLEAVGVLAGGIAHEFNNILGIILGNIDLALQDLTRMPQTQERLRRIESVSERARQLVRQLTIFSRSVPQSRKPVDLCRAAEEVAGRLRGSLPPQLTLALHAVQALPVLADGLQLEEVVINLVTNAVEAMDGSAGCIDVSLSRFTLDEASAEPNPALRALRESTGDRHTEWACMNVTDTGLGMNEQVLGRIFEPFYRGWPSGSGNGLGLSVALGIVRGHGGTITVQSSPGKGTTFSVYLPVCEANEGVPGQSATAPSANSVITGA